jgi:hypothetical protein
MDPLKAAAFKAFDYWSTHFLSKSGSTFVFPVILSELHDAVSTLKRLLPKESESIDELLDYLKEFGQRYDGVEIDNKDPFNISMLALMERLKNDLPGEVHIALQNVHDALV